MNTWKVILATVVIFAAGVVTGGLLVNYVDRAKERRPRRVETGLGPWYPQRRDVVRMNEPAMQPALERLRMNFLLRATRELRLTPTQRERVERIIREGQEKTKAIWDRIAPQLRKELDEVRGKIRAELTPEQRARFEELLRQPAPRRSEPPPGPERRARDGRPPLPAPPPPDPGVPQLPPANPRPNP